MNKKIFSVVLADDHEIFLDGIKLVLSLNEELKVVGVAKNGKELVKLVKQYKPNLVLTDITMPELNGIEASKKILKISPQTKIIVLTMHDDANTYEETMQAGVHGYLLKKSGKTILENAIKIVLKGGLFTLEDNHS
jgi:two-component system, NarL family, response regulator DegU